MSAPSSAGNEPSRRLLTVLAVLAVLELVTLGVLLINLATIHARPITQAIGPIHGAVYITIVVIMIFAPGFRTSDRAWGWVPIVGGTIALVRARRSRANRGEPTSMAAPGRAEE